MGEDTYRTETCSAQVVCYLYLVTLLPVSGNVITCIGELKYQTQVLR